GMYKSVDGGATWTLETNCTTSTSNCIPYFTSFNYAYQNQNNDTGIDQSWYDNTISIDPLNTNIVVAGGVTAVESIDGGANWVNLGGSGSTTFSKIHPDFHALAFDSAGNLYMGNDGGVWEMSTANLTSQTLNYTNLNSNLDITQFYPGISQTNNASDIVAGSQDNGTVQYLSTSPPASAWNQVDGGDGGAVAIDPSNPNFQVAESNISLQGSLDATSNDWQTTTPLTVPPFVSTNWFSPLAIVPNTLGPTILFGGDGVYLSSDGGQTWSSPTGYGASNVSALAIAPSNPSVIYAGFSDGTIQMSSDAGTTWTTVDNINNDVTHLAVSASDPFTLYVSGAVAYTGVVSWAGPPQVLMGTALDTASPSWTDLSGNLPSNDQTNTVISDGNGGLIVANEMGVYWTNTIQGTSTNWARLGAGLPNVQVMDLLLTSGGTLIAATHGRGMWTLPFSIVTNTSTTVCTWAGGTGSSGSDWSVGANWVTTAGSSCTGAGGPPTGAQVVFPANPLNTSVTWDSGTESGSGGVPANSFDSITIQSAAYVFANANAASAITLSPTVATPSCGASATIALCAAFPSGTLTLPFDFALTGFSEIASKYAASTLDVTGALSGAGSTLVIGDVSNVGVVSLSATSDGFTSGVVVNGGMLNVSGTITNSSITVQSGTTLDVSGTVGSITNDGGTISPELSPTTPGTLTTLGNVDLQALGTGQLDVLLAGSTPGTGYSQLLVNSGSINLDDATLIVNRVFTPAGGSNIVLVSLTGGATTTGTFLGLADGATIVVNGLTFVVSYPSQDGGDPTQGVLLTPLTAPDAPTIGTVTSASTTASVAWSAPASNGGVAITGYVVTAADATSSTNGGQTCTWTSGPLTCSLSGLTYGDSYTFSVTATNTIGTSGASASSNAVTPLPNPPGPVTVTFAARSSTLSPVARRALLGLSKKLIAQASLKITAYAPKNAALAHRRGRAVTLYLTSLVKVGVVIVARTTGSANKAIVVTIKE
ncbi:MAG TPA: fibronectin type III domain-containing protein, partial [Acidimicrobiales bacterium]|nr:fibronectin type III domain-containing protein [Acidimicrobiales bacterium]